MNYLELGILKDAALSLESKKNYSNVDNGYSGVNIGISVVKVGLMEHKLNTNPDDDKFVFQMSLLSQGNSDTNKHQHRFEYSRKELTEVFSDRELTRLMLKSHINGQCKIEGEFYCEDCEYEDRCSEEREEAASARIPADADLGEVNSIMESPEYCEGLTTTCWKIRAGIAMRLLPENEAKEFSHHKQS